MAHCPELAGRPLFALSICVWHLGTETSEGVWAHVGGLLDLRRAGCVMGKPFLTHLFTHS